MGRGANNFSNGIGSVCTQAHMDRFVRAVSGTFILMIYFHNEFVELLKLQAVHHSHLLVRCCQSWTAILVGRGDFNSVAGLLALAMSAEECERVVLGGELPVNAAPLAKFMMQLFLLDVPGLHFRDFPVLD